MRRLACVGRGAAFRGLPRKQAPEGPYPGRRFESRSQAPRGAWSTGAWAVAVPVLPGCPATGPREGTGLDLAGTCPCGGTPLVAAREMIGAEQRRSRMVDGAATRRPPAHVPRCRGAGTQTAGRVLAERPTRTTWTGVRRAPATPSSLTRGEGLFGRRTKPGAYPPAGRRNHVLRTPTPSSPALSR
jgi:hypothetical protein